MPSTHQLQINWDIKNPFYIVLKSFSISSVSQLSASSLALPANETHLDFLIISTTSVERKSISHQKIQRIQDGTLMIGIHECKGKWNGSLI